MKFQELFSSSVQCHVLEGFKKEQKSSTFFFPGSFFFQEGIFEDFYWDCCHLFFVYILFWG